MRWWLALVVMVSCSRPGGPAGAYDDWRSAVRKGDRATMKAMVEDESVLPRSRDVSRGRVREVRWSARQGKVVWTFTRGRWRISRLPSFIFSNATPVDAVRSFVHSIRYGRWEMVLRLLPSWVGARLSPQQVSVVLSPKRPEVDAFVKEVMAALAAPVVVETEGRAYFYYGDGAVLELNREEDGWHVSSPY